VLLADFTVLHWAEEDFMVVVEEDFTAVVVEEGKSPAELIKLFLDRILFSTFILKVRNSE
jgi:hypothetical protein